MSLSVIEHVGQQVSISPRQRRVSFAPLIVGSAIMLVALARRSRLGAWLRGFLSVADVPTRIYFHECVLFPRRVREELLGRSKAIVAARLGPPRTAVVGDRVATTSPDDFWNARIWYYSIDPSGHTAMAVRFDGGRASAVDFFVAPHHHN